MNIAQVINDLISDLTPRQKTILEQRFGLKTGKKTTLAAIGEKYGLTRERVRQIEEGGLKSVSEKIKSGSVDKIFAAINDCLAKFGYARREDFLVADLGKSFNDKNFNARQLKFLLKMTNKFNYYFQDSDFHAFWYRDKQTFKKIQDFINKLVKFFSGKKEELLIYKKFDELFTQAKPRALQDSIALNYLSLSKKFDTNRYGDFGLSQWEEIKPKTMRVKAYLVLKKHRKPMHFKQVAEEINKAEFDKRVALPQTVHNELIRDPRFVLVGRGTYGLKEFGFMPGTAREVIAQLLKTKGPLHPKEVVDLTLQQRMLRENTILLNLQNREYFKRLPDGRYHLA